MRLTRLRLKINAPTRIEDIDRQTFSAKKFSVSEYLVWLFKRRSFTLEDYRAFTHTRFLKQIDDVNKFFNQEFLFYGSELHAANYAIKLGGRVKFYESSKWFSKFEDIGKELGIQAPTMTIANSVLSSSIRPLHAANECYVEKLDLAKTVIKADGLSNFEHCSRLTSLCFAGCSFVDNWTLVRLAHMFSMTLEELDISDCSLVNDQGLLPLAFLVRLKRLHIKNLTNAKNRHYISILLEDELASNNLEILGNDLDSLTSEDIENITKS